MPRYMLDTNICIYIRQKRPPAILARFERLRPGDACISLITYGELRYGAEKSADRDTALKLLAELVSLLPVAPMPDEAAVRYGAIRADLERRGEMIGNNDLWIAANALALGTRLVTNNTREFDRVNGLKVETWARD